MTPLKTALLTTRLTNLIWRICDKRRIQIEISEDCVGEVLVRFGEEMKKLAHHQKSSVSVSKRIGALVFWVRRLKPIAFACKVNSEVEIRDINEQVSVWLIHELLTYFISKQRIGKPVASVLPTVKKSDFTSYAYKYWTIDSHYNYLNFVYALRYRSFSHHHISLYIEAILTGFALKHMP